MIAIFVVLYLKLQPRSQFQVEQLDLQEQIDALTLKSKVLINLMRQRLEGNLIFSRKLIHDQLAYDCIEVLYNAYNLVIFQDVYCYPSPYSINLLRAQIILTNKNGKMIQAYFIIFLLCNSYGIEKREKFLNIGQDDTFHNDPAFDQLQEIYEHPLGAKILQTVALQLESGDSLASISKLLNDLKGDLEAKQVDADGAHTQFQSQCKTDLDNYGQRITLAVNEINDSEFKVGRFEDDMGDYEGELELKTNQIASLQAKDASLRDLRLQQAASFNSRTSQLKEMIQAFVVILPKLHDFYDRAVAQESFIEEEALTQALVELSKGPIDNPIIALVSLTTALDPTSIQTIIEKMEVIRDSLIASVTQEEELEARAKRDSDVTLNEIFNAIEILSREKANDEESLAECIRGRDIQAKRSSDAQAEFSAAKKGLKQRREQCQQTLVQYQQNTIQRSKEIQIIKDVQNIIATKINVVAAFIQEQDNI